ncbi:MAG: BTAD domain-containing putative transcriptional regulator [Ignavibacteria bacterium]
MTQNRVRQVIQTRITAPKAPQNIIARSGIVKLLTASEGKKLLLVTAPAGYGKTTLVNELINSSGKTTAWIHVTPDIKNVFNLLTYIISSLNRINEQFGGVIFETISLVENDSEKINDMGSALGELAGLMVNELLVNFTGEVMIVIDDLHELQSEKYVMQFLDLLISDLPDNIQLVIISRELPGINLTHLRAKRLISEVTQKELVFTKDEIKSLALKIYSKPLTEKEFTYLQTSVGGWITGIHLVMQSIEENTEDQLSTIPPNLFDYFAGEIFIKLNSQTQDFLLKTSHLENFDSDICNVILDSDSSAEVLGYLLGKNIFLESKQYISSDGKVVINYDYVQLFRTFLLTKSKELLTEYMRKDILYRTSVYYQTNSHHEKAIDYAVLSGNREYSEELLTQNFDEFFLKGNFEKLWEWVNAFEENSPENLKHFFYYKGVLCKYFLGQLDKATEYLDMAIEISGNQKDEDFRMTALTMKLEIMLNQGNTSGALEILTGLENIRSSDINKAKIFYFLGNIYFQNNDLARSLEYSNKALELCENAGNITIIEDIYNLLGNINIIKGEFVQSTHYYELLLSMTRSLQKKLLAQGNLAILYSRSGKFGKARECYEETLKLFRFFSSPVFEIVVKMTEYTLSFESGDFTAALAIAAEINKLSLKLKNSQYICLSFRFLGECSYYLNKFESAVKYHELAGSYLNISSENDSLLNLLFKAISKINSAPPEETEKELTKAYAYFTSIESSYDRSIAGFYLAKFYYINNNPETCSQYLEIVFKLSKEKGYFSFLLREYISSEEIFKLLPSEYKASYKEFLAASSEIAELSWISENYKEFLKSFIESKYDLKMLAFGGLKFFLKGEEIPEKKWVRKKRKLFLCYLIHSHNQTISKDKIVDVFFGDTPVESVDNIFHQAVSNIRTALRNNIGVEHKGKVKPAEPDYIIYEDKTLRFNRIYSFYSDLDEFDNLIRNSGSAESAVLTIEYLKKACELYSGDVLEGYYEGWCESIREEYKSKFIKSSEKLLGLFLAQNRFDEILEYSRKLNQADKLNIPSIKSVVKAYIETGKGNLARRNLEKFIAQYEDEIGEKLPKTILNDLEGLFEK